MTRKTSEAQVAALLARAETLARRRNIEAFADLIDQTSQTSFLGRTLHPEKLLSLQKNLAALFLDNPEFRKKYRVPLTIMFSSQDEE